MKLFLQRNLCIFLLIPLLAFAEQQLFVEADAGVGPLLHAIDNAKQSITITLYGFTQRDLLQHLANAKKRGVDVNLLLEPKPYRAEAENEAAIRFLRERDISLCFGNALFQLTHQKSMVIDHQQVWIMTGNWVYSAFKKQRNFFLMLTDADLAREIETVKKADCAQQAPPLNSTQLVWSPVNARTKLARLIDDSTDSLQIYSEQLADYSLVGKIAAAAKRGVLVEIITNPPHNKKALKPIKYLTRNGAQVHYSNTYYIHAKMIIADQKQAYLGSINLSYASLQKNRELGIIIDDAAILSQLRGVFEKDWR